MKNLTWQNPEQLFVAQELINKVKSKCCGIKDDEESAIDNLCLALKPYGQIVVEGVAHNGAAGLKLIEKVRPDLVFQDVELPDMLGMELVTRARKKLGVNMEVVFYTAYNKYMIDGST